MIDVIKQEVMLQCSYALFAYTFLPATHCFCFVKSDARSIIATRELGKKKGDDIREEVSPPKKVREPWEEVGTSWILKKTIGRIAFICVIMPFAASAQ